MEKQNWGANWENREVTSIKTISETKDDCQNLKNDLSNNLIIRYYLAELQSMRLEAINAHNVNNEIPYSNEIKILQKILADSNTRIDHY